MRRDFENLIVKVEPAPEVGSRGLRDVGHVDLGAQTYSEAFDLDGRPAAGIAISLLPEATRSPSPSAVHDKMEELKKSFPKVSNMSSPTTRRNSSRRRSARSGRR